MECRWCGITNEIYPYWRNNFCCDKINCVAKDSFVYQEATHLLECAHQINPTNRNEYFMPCIILKELPNNRAKILIFGDRRIKLEISGHKKRIRYVSKDRLKRKAGVRKR